MSGDEDTSGCDPPPDQAIVQSAPESRSPAARPTPEHLTIGKKGDAEQHGGDSSTGGQPRDLDRQLANTDTTIKWFTVISGTAAAVSAGAAIYAASQIGGANRQTEAAIKKIADLAKSADDEAKAMRGQIVVMQRQADSTAALVGPAKQSADAAITGIHQQEVHFRLDERPILDIADSDPDMPKVSAGLTMDGGRPRWALFIKNYGKTSAEHIQLDSWMRIGELKFHPSRGRNEGDATIVPGRIIFYSVVYDETITQMTHPIVLTQGGKFLTVNVLIRYRDAAGDNYTKTICFDVNFVNKRAAYCDFSAVPVPELGKPQGTAQSGKTS